LGVARKQESTHTYFRSGADAVSVEYKTVPYLGAGLSYALNDQVHFDMAFDYIFNAGNSRHLLSLGVTAGLPGDRQNFELAKSFYVGGTIGRGKPAFDCSAADECENSGIGGKLYGGMNVSSNLAVEVGLVKLGRLKYSGSSSGTPYSLDAKASAVTLGGVARIPVGWDLSGVARLGAARVTTNVNVGLGSFSGSADRTDVQEYWGYGVEYGLTKDVKLTGALDTTKASLPGGLSATVRLFSVGAEKTF
jgi:opacity protein-like surface antigen